MLKGLRKNLKKKIKQQEFGLFEEMLRNGKVHELTTKEISGMDEAKRKRFYAVMYETTNKNSEKVHEVLRQAKETQSSIVEDCWNITDKLDEFKVAENNISKQW